MARGPSRVASAKAVKDRIRRMPRKENWQHEAKELAKKGETLRALRVLHDNGAAQREHLDAHLRWILDNEEQAYEKDRTNVHTGEPTTEPSGEPFSSDTGDGEHGGGEGTALSSNSDEPSEGEDRRSVCSNSSPSGSEEPSGSGD